MRSLHENKEKLRIVLDVLVLSAEGMQVIWDVTLTHLLLKVLFIYT